MRTRTWIFIAVTVGVGIAASDRNLAAAYIALVGGGIVYLLHTIEFKLKKLLDHHGISVPDYEIAKD